MTLWAWGDLTYGAHPTLPVAHCSHPGWLDMRLLCLLCHRAEWLACVFFFFFLLPVPVPCEVVRPSTNQPQCHLLQVLLHHSSAPRLATSCAQRVFHLAAKLGGAWFSGSSPPHSYSPRTCMDSSTSLSTGSWRRRPSGGSAQACPRKGSCLNAPL